MQVAAQPDSAVQHTFSPNPLPRPLGDPLYTFRPFIAVLIAINLIVSAGLFLLSFSQNDQLSLIQAGTALIAPAFLIVVYALALPKQSTNVFYLRSFKKDASSYKVREMLEVALGADFRLSGIRDPKKRVPHFLKPVLLVPMMLAYAGSKYLNLEAKEDWKARLWRSLGDARAVVLDVRDLTDFVMEEIELVLTCMTPERILFVVQNEEELNQLRKHFATKGIEFPVGTHVAVWNETRSDNTPKFMLASQLFVQQLPKPAAGLALQAAPLVTGFVKSGQALRREKFNALIQYTLGMALLVALSSLHGETGWLGEWPLLGVVLAMLVVLQLVLLPKHCVGVFKKIRMARSYNPLYQGILRVDLIKGLGLALLLLAMAGGLMFVGLREVYTGYTNRAEQYSFDARYRALELITMDVFLDDAPAIVDAATLLDSLGPDSNNSFKLNGANLDFVGTPASVWVAVPQTAEKQAILGFSWGEREIVPACAAETLEVLQVEFNGQGPIYQRCLMNLR